MLVIDVKVRTERLKKSGRQERICLVKSDPEMCEKCTHILEELFHGSFGDLTVGITAAQWNKLDAMDLIGTGSSKGQ